MSLSKSSWPLAVVTHETAHPPLACMHWPCDLLLALRISMGWPCDLLLLDNSVTQGQDVLAPLRPPPPTSHLGHTLSE